MTGSVESSDWPESVEDALEDQRRLSTRLISSPLELSAVRTILCVGVGYSEKRQAAVASGVLARPDGSPERPGEVFLAECPSKFPYKPGLFAYREGPGVMRLLDSLPGLPDLLVFHSQGIAHPRGFGLAAHIGVLVETPSLGLTRKRLVGRYVDPPLEAGASSVLSTRGGGPVGLAYRPLSGCEVFFASPGHLTQLSTLRAFLQGVTSYKACFPEALTLAQSAANKRAFSKPN